MSVDQLGVDRAKRLSEADTKRRPRTVSKLPDRETYTTSLPADCVRKLDAGSLRPVFHDGYGPLIVDIPAIVLIPPRESER